MKADTLEWTKTHACMCTAYAFKKNSLPLPANTPLNFTII